MSLRRISHFDVDSNAIEMLSSNFKPKEQEPKSSTRRTRNRNLEEVYYWRNQAGWNGNDDGDGDDVVVYGDDYVATQQAQLYHDDMYNDDATWYYNANAIVYDDDVTWTIDDYHVMHGPKMFSALRFGGVLFGILVAILVFFCPYTVRKKKIEDVEDDDEDNESDASPPPRRSSTRSVSSSRNRSTSRKRSRSRKRIKDSFSSSDDDYELMEKEKEDKSGNRKKMMNERQRSMLV